MKIRERSMALLLALMMALGLTACGKKAVEAEPYNGIVYVGRTCRWTRSCSGSKEAAFWAISSIWRAIEAEGRWSLCACPWREAGWRSCRRISPMKTGTIIP